MIKRIFLDPKTKYLYKCRRDFKIVLASKDVDANLKLFPPIDENDIYGGYVTRNFIVGKKDLLLMYKRIS